MLSIAQIRSAIEAGLTDEEIIEGADAQEFEDAAYGPNDYHEGREFGSCRETFGRNDAGEWIGLM